MKLPETFNTFARLLMNRLKKTGLLVLALTWVGTMHAQDTTADFMRSTGKIYVVAAVTIVILVIIFIYLILLDRKISRLEKRHKNE